MVDLNANGDNENDIEGERVAVSSGFGQDVDVEIIHTDEDGNTQWRFICYAVHGENSIVVLGGEEVNVTEIDQKSVWLSG